MIQTAPPKIKMIALRNLYYAGVWIAKDQPFDCRVENVRILTAHKSAKVADGDRKREYNRRDMRPEK